MERVLGDWAPTLRLAVLLLIVLAGLVAAIIVLLGFGDALVVFGAAGLVKVLSVLLVKPARI